MTIKSNDEPELRLDRTAFSVVPLSSNDLEDKLYWLSRTPEERLCHLELLRRVNYGDKATGRLQRVLEIAKLSRG